MFARVLVAAGIAFSGQAAEADDWFDCSMNHSFILDEGGFLEERRVSAFVRRNHPGLVERNFSFDRDSGQYIEGIVDWKFLIV